VITSNIIQRTLKIKFGPEEGVGFLVEISGREYLIFAKHILDGIHVNPIVSVFVNNSWIETRARLVGYGDIFTDIAVVALNQKIIQGHLPVKVGPNINISQDVYFLGFPHNRFTDIANINGGYPAPFVKRALVSSFDEDFIYLDGFNNKGFSGGPVVWVNHLTQEITIFAVIRSTVLESLTEKTPTQSGEERVWTNSGIIRAVSITHALDLINSNPIGAL